MRRRLANLRTRYKVALAFLALLLLVIIVGAAFGSAGMNQEFQPQNEFQLEDWVPIHLGPINLSITKAVLYLLLSAILTTATMIYVANRMQARPNRVQTAVETAYTLMRDNIARGNMDAQMARRWFPFVGTLFLFIWWANMIGYIPLPVNSGEPFYVNDHAVPSFQIYAATANLSVPLALSLMVWFTYHVVGIRALGVRRYFASWLPAGTPGGPMKGLIFGIELISQFVRIISLSVRLFANILAGHMLILFMGGGLVVLLGLAALGVITVPLAVIFYVFETVLIATLQAFIFATLAAIYLGEAVAAEH